MTLTTTSDTADIRRVLDHIDAHQLRFSDIGPRTLGSGVEVNAALDEGEYAAWVHTLDTIAVYHDRASTCLVSVVDTLIDDVHLCLRAVRVDIRTEVTA